MRTNHVKAMLAAGEPVLGTFVRTTHPAVVEVLGLVGFTFVIIDNEHSPLDLESTANLIRAADGVGMTPLVRVRTNDPVAIMQALDAGALGVQVPQISSRADAARAARAVKYPPAGTRGLATSHRAADHGLMDPLEYVRQADRETMLLAYVENREAVECLEEIVAVPNVDLLFIGPADLSASYGHPAETSHPDVQRAIDRVLRVAGEARIPVGTVASDAPSARALLDRGVRLLAISSDLQMIGRWGADTLRSLRD